MFIPVSNRRNSNIELLRIITILMIVINHMALYSGILFNTLSLSFNDYATMTFVSFGNLGVNIFFIISSYYLVNTKPKSVPKHSVKLYLQTVFYALLLYLLLVFTNVSKFDGVTFAKLFISPFDSTWWFLTFYFILYLCHPLLNWILSKLSKTGYFILTLFVFVVLSIDIVPINIWCFAIYLITGFIKKYVNISKIKSRYFFIAFFLILGTYYGIIFGITSNSGIEAYPVQNFLYQYYLQRHPIITLVCFLLVYGVMNLKERHSTVINTLSGCAFAAYLIHEYPPVRQWLWNDFIHISTMIDEWYYLFVYLGVALAVFAIAVVVDLLRQHIEYKVLAKPLNAIDNIHIFKRKENLEVN